MKYIMGLALACTLSACGHQENILILKEDCTTYPKPTYMSKETQATIAAAGTSFVLNLTGKTLTHMLGNSYSPTKSITLSALGVPASIVITNTYKPDSAVLGSLLGWFLSTLLINHLQAK